MANTTAGGNCILAMCKREIEREEEHFSGDFSSLSAAEGENQEKEIGEDKDIVTDRDLRDEAALHLNSRRRWIHLTGKQCRAEDFG